MARSSLSLFSLLGIFLSASLHHLSAAAAFDLAEPVPQRLSQRQTTFEGGWAIGLPGTTCPSDAPTVCTSSNIANPACCPSGTTCFGLSSLYCCPTDTDCGSVVEEFPRCANASWTLYSLKTSGYFCCPQGQFGVLPVQNYGGLCQPNGVNLPASRIASAISSQELTQGGNPTQTGNSPATTSTGRTTRTITSLSTGTDGSVSKITQVSTGVATFTNAAPGSTAPASGQNSNGNGNGSTPSSSSNSLGTGAIAGIVIGGLAVLALFILAFLLYRYLSNKNKRSNNAGFLPQEQAPQYSAVPRQDNISPNPEMQGYQSPPLKASGLYTGETQTPGTMSPMHSGGYGERPVEVPAPPQAWEGRAEIGSSR